jgi:D-alanyl-D-alanine carboxypeptidase
MTQEDHRAPVPDASHMPDQLSPAAGGLTRTRPVIRDGMRLLACLALLCGVTACSSLPGHHITAQYTPSRCYPSPGPLNDRWGPYIREASGRFGIEEPLIREVMRQESGGREEAVSRAGAIGLMQVMPNTYDELRQRYKLGGDPFNPRNNILAGVAYLREMSDRFGVADSLAAYNAGPGRLENHLSGDVSLPVETIKYVASIQLDG